MQSGGLEDEKCKCFGMLKNVSLLVGRKEYFFISGLNHTLCDKTVGRWYCTFLGKVLVMCSIVTSRGQYYDRLVVKKYHYIHGQPYTQQNVIFQW